MIRDFEILPNAFGATEFWCIVDPFYIYYKEKVPLSFNL